MKKTILMLFVFVALTLNAQTNIELNNPSFEDGTTGWTLSKMTRQSNDNFTKKDGTYYMQSWKARGSKIDNAYIHQTIKGLKQGKYRLSANACHVQQAEANVDVNVEGDPQTGAYIYAGDYMKEVTASDTYSVDFAIMGSQNSIEIGAKAVSATGNYFAVDNFVLTYLGDADVADYKNAITLLIAQAREIASTSTTALNNAMSNAQTVVDDESATLESAKQAYDTLSTEYKNAVAAQSITNPSFENGVNGWTVKNMVTQSNSVFTRKQGNYYLESWVARGTTLSDASVCQTVALPSGSYRLSAYALHIQQNGENSTANTGAAQKGAYIYAGTAQTVVTSSKLYTVNFSVLKENDNVEIGLKAENPTGNYLCVDYFTISYQGEVEVEDYLTVIDQLIALGDTYLEKGIQTKVATSLNDAIEAANEAKKGIGTDDEGNAIYDMAALSNAVDNLKTYVDAAKASRALYDALQARIDYARKVLGWWKDEPYKESKIPTLEAAIATAQEKLVDYSMTDTRINAAISTLNTKILQVDKKIYTSTNACGTETQLNSDNSQWSYARSLQSKHWILFWEKGYGADAPAVVPGILDTADKIFEFYANDLGYININSGKSKTDTYKMIIRLKYSTDWEASGSGIDNVIGLLTLSNGAHTSRSGQTVAHEIGHCFQYQTHCDNGDWNGWMYNWGNSTLNVFWEMCAQWQAYKFYPSMQFVWDSNRGNDWFGGSINGLHRHPLCVDLRYNNYFIQDYFCHKQNDMKFLGRMWNESRNPEDPFQTYMRLTMSGTTEQKLAQLGDEMWEYGARMTTFDLDPIRNAGASRIGFRDQTSLTKDSENYWWPTKSNCIENFGNNAIRINAPTTGKTIYVEFEGKAGASGYNSYNVSKAGWRVGFVAYKRDGTRVYGDATPVTYDDANVTIAFECPSNCSYVWLVVSGAPTSYWTRDWLSWSEESTVEQWPYRVKFYQTNVYGQANNNTYPTAIDIIDAGELVQPQQDNNVYTVTGQIVRHGTTSLEGLPEGIYIVGGKKIMKRD